MTERKMEEKESNSIVAFMVDPVSRSSDVDIRELHACFRASTIVLSAELQDPPPPALVVQFAMVAAITGLKTAITRVR